MFASTAPAAVQPWELAIPKRSTTAPPQRPSMLGRLGRFIVRTLGMQTADERPGAAPPAVEGGEDLAAEAQRSIAELEEMTAEGEAGKVGSE